MELKIPDLCLVVLVGASGSGKSTFARKHFLPTQVLSSDYFRGLVADDENDQSASVAAFDVLHYVASKRLEAGRVTVVDATNVQPQDRARLVEVARRANVLPVAIVLDTPTAVCLARNAQRPDRDFGAHVVKRHRAALRRSLKFLGKEGFKRVHVLRSESDVDNSTIVYERLLNDLKHETGPFDVFGDVHGCRAELEELLTELGYTLVRDDEGRAVDAVPPGDRKAVFVGDLVDRGPDTPGVLRLVMGMVARGHAFSVRGNHEEKLVRAMRGHKVTVRHGLEKSLEQFAHEPEEFRLAATKFCDSLVAHYVLDGGKLVVAHAGLPERYHGRASAKVRSFALYGDTTGETDAHGLPVRLPWANDYRGSAMVLYGHVLTPEAEWINNTMCLETGVVFGGKLTALRYPEKELVSVKAHQTWYENDAPFPPKAVERAPDVLALTDVTGTRRIDTSLIGAVTIRAEQSASALEVMSRFAIDPHELLYLPPTMAPVATSQRDDVLEHPEEAFAEYRSARVEQVICEEKHMGSRAVLLVRKVGGAIYTRTGRAFFDGALGTELLDGVRSACAGLFEELATDWLLIDAELMPWNAKASGLIREQYAAVGAAANGALPVAVDALATAASRGVDVTELLARTTQRASNAAAYSAAYERYCWPTDGLEGVRIAPFQLLAAEGRTFHDRSHLWHLETLGKLEGPLFQRTRHLVVDVNDPAQVAAGVQWWQDLTGAGGEGMVVKPLANLGGRVQPGVKVRGREYLRIIYGPDYTSPENLSRLRKRSLGRKRGLALREYALGIEALERLVRGEPLWRVHECVFGVLALESEPVDPRL
ncbi:polynucleotide kinase-phosphatase [Lentzea flaviverrucosa]|uniref:Polynucleotide kinase-phosphatase n=1 Tax=Lentzea flaviverrucosa TaxID=200379 RepID=A0A1H9MH95_9PSEU|nr:polynucleotide kinase-phosphatase [Lentzea flaviverrucosa]RDI30927.1 polynucleotide kinase-phosphatase [Lentzea flaviverrucosa]SER22827.1 polynucleotide kinase-phosphatase [Lentzea flaviverrucosa]